MAATKSVAVGANLSLSVAVTGGETPYTYVWKKGGVVIADKITAAIQVNATTEAGDAGSYTCEVTDKAGTKITSVACVVTVA